MTGRRRSVLRGRLVTQEAVLPDGVVAIDDARIAWVGGAGEWGYADGWPAAAEVAGTVLPGLVDVHCHGAAGFGFPDADPRGVGAAAAHHRAHGTTTLLASLVTTLSRSWSPRWTSARISWRPAPPPVSTSRGPSSRPPGQAPTTPGPSATPISPCSHGYSTPDAATCEP